MRRAVRCTAPGRQRRRAGASGFRHLLGMQRRCWEPRRVLMLLQYLDYYL